MSLVVEIVRFFRFVGRVSPVPCVSFFRGFLVFCFFLSLLLSRIKVISG